jgi:glucose-6-phosphate isomerase
MKIQIDFTNMIGEAVGGVTESEWRSAGSEFSAAYAGFEKLRSSGDVGFVDIARDTALRDQSVRFAEQVKGRFDDVVILGIGGSALGPIALRTALRPSA